MTQMERIAVGAPLNVSAAGRPSTAQPPAAAPPSPSLDTETMASPVEWIRYLRTRDPLNDIRFMTTYPLAIILRTSRDNATIADEEKLRSEVRGVRSRATIQGNLEYDLRELLLASQRWVREAPAELPVALVDFVATSHQYLDVMIRQPVTKGYHHDNRESDLLATLISEAEERGEFAHLSNASPELRTAIRSLAGHVAETFINCPRVQQLFDRIRDREKDSAANGGNGVKRVNLLDNQPKMDTLNFVRLLLAASVGIERVTSEMIVRRSQENSPCHVVQGLAVQAARRVAIAAACLMVREVNRRLPLPETVLDRIETLSRESFNADRLGAKRAKFAVEAEERQGLEELVEIVRTAGKVVHSVAQRYGVYLLNDLASQVSMEPLVTLLNELNLPEPRTPFLTLPPGRVGLVLRTPHPSVPFILFSFDGNRGETMVLTKVTDPSARSIRTRCASLDEGGYTLPLEDSTLFVTKEAAGEFSPSELSLLVPLTQEDLPESLPHEHFRNTLSRVVNHGKDLLLQLWVNHPELFGSLQTLRPALFVIENGSSYLVTGSPVNDTITKTAPLTEESDGTLLASLRITALNEPPLKCYRLSAPAPVEHADVVTPAEPAAQETALSFYHEYRSRGFLSTAKFLRHMRSLGVTLKRHGEHAVLVGPSGVSYAFGLNSFARTETFPPNLIPGILRIWGIDTQSFLDSLKRR